MIWSRHWSRLNFTFESGRVVKPHSFFLYHPSIEKPTTTQNFSKNDHTIKTPGIVWNPTQDVFLFKVAHVEWDTFDKNNVTKRQLLSDISKYFDPLGWLSPVSIQLKQMMQKTWEASANWDDKLPDYLVKTYLGWRSKLSSLKEMKLKVWVLLDGFTDKVDVHLFCDASEKAYAACIYIFVSTNDGTTKSCHLVAKTKVAPITFQSIPRLELCAVLLGARLPNIESNQSIEPANRNSIRLDWLNNRPKLAFSWTKPFVYICEQLGFRNSRPKFNWMESRKIWRQTSWPCITGHWPRCNPGTLDVVERAWLAYHRMFSWTLFPEEVLEEQKKTR